MKRREEEEKLKRDSELKFWVEIWRKNTASFGKQILNSGKAI